METAWRVEFRNVGSSYFPQSRVECHYSISSQHMWASNDWVGLFKVGWSSVRDYHTFVWALAPAGYQEGTDVNCCVHFQASYFPKPSSQEYQFVYVDGKGEVVSRSPQFTFGAPQPLEDLVTVEEGPQGEEGGADMLLVVPRAELLQARLQECLRERAELLQAQEAAGRAGERERERYERAREAWDRGRAELERHSAALQEELRQGRQRMEQMERKQAEVQVSGAAAAEERSTLQAQRAASQLRVRELEEDITALTLRALERETELERMKERAKKVASQRREEEEDRRSLLAKLEQTEGELRGLSGEFQGLRSSLAQRDTQALQLRDTIATLTHRLANAHRKEVESEASLGEMRSLRERLRGCEGQAEGLRGEVGVVGLQRDQAQADLHQARLQSAQLTLQLADASLALREGRAGWARERQGLQRCSEKDRERLETLSAEMQRMEESLQEERMEREKVEVELGREKDCNRVQLSEARREQKEVQASLRAARKEKEQLLVEKQELMEYMVLLEQRVEAVAEAKWSAAMLVPAVPPHDPRLDSEDESPEALRPPRPSPPRPYGLCDQAQPDPLPPSPCPASPRELSLSLSRGGGRRRGHQPARPPPFVSTATRRGRRHADTQLRVGGGGL